MFIKTLLRLPKVLRRKDFFLCRDVKLHTLTLGNRFADWTFHPEFIDANSIVYSFGVGTDISFDLGLIKLFKSNIHAFDPTPKSIEWIKTQQLPSEFIFHEIGLAPYDGTAEFTLPSNPNHVSATLLQKESSSGFFKADVNRLRTIMNKLSHDHLDLMKMDIEGIEYEVIDDIISSRIQIKQLLIEFHHRFPNVGIKKSLNTIQKLRNSGYSIFHISATGEEFSFIKK